MATITGRTAPATVAAKNVPAEISDVSAVVPSSFQQTNPTAGCRTRPPFLISVGTTSPTSIAWWLKELAQSIKAQGFKVRLIVRQGKAGNFEIVAGRCRYRAAQLAGQIWSFRVEHMPWPAHPEPPLVFRLHELCRHKSGAAMTRF